LLLLLSVVEGSAAVSSMRLSAGRGRVVGGAARMGLLLQVTLLILTSVGFTFRALAYVFLTTPRKPCDTAQRTYHRAGMAQLSTAGFYQDL
jgi:hypothetical protein